MTSLAVASVVINAGTVRFSGPLLRRSVAGLWRQLPSAADPVHRIDLSAVESIDSAGLALVSLLAARHGDVVIDGNPQGYAELRAAYRLGHNLAFARD